MNGSYRCLRKFVKNVKILNCNVGFSAFNKVTFISMNSKPPNIFVFTGNNCSKLFRNVEDSILKCLQVHSYLVYHLLPAEVNKQPWMENALLLVISCDDIHDSFIKTFENFVKNFGNILLVCSKFNNYIAGYKCVSENFDKEKLTQINFKDIGKALLYREKYSYCSSKNTVLCYDNNSTPVIHKTVFTNGIVIASEIYIDRDPDTSQSVAPKYNKELRLMILKNVLQEFGLKAKQKDCFTYQISAGYFMSDKELEELRITSSLKLNSSAKTTFRECTLKCLGTETKLPIYYSNDEIIKSLNFDKSLYFSNLSTHVYGHYLVYCPVISSTMEVAEQLSDYEGIVIVANYQINGQGRGGNKWISPIGCAMFTLRFTLPIFSNIGQKMSLVQHIASLAVVHGIRNQEQYKNLNLKIKWPNDIYIGDSKIGGLIVTSMVIGNLANISVGWGINVANDRPTICINDAIDKFNSEHKSSLPHLHTEEIIASTISQMEYFIEDFKKSGPDQFLLLYYSYWMHNHQKVTLINLNEKGTVIGLDEYGFLIIETDNGKQITLQPDGNRFDIMKNLIYSR